MSFEASKQGLVLFTVTSS